MLELFFSIKAEILSGEQVRLVGSLPGLGSWEPERGMVLLWKKGMFQGGPLQVKFEEYFQFKIVKTGGVNGVQWESLPNNRNRKFKPKRSTKIHLQWSKPEGRISRFGGGKDVMMSDLAREYFLTKEKSKLKLQKHETFDPYMDAYEAVSSEEQSQEEEFVVRRKRISDVLSTSRTDFQELFYRTGRFEICEALNKKAKVYIVCQKINLEDGFQRLVLEKTRELSRQYLIKWITAECFDGEKREGLKFSHRSIGTIFDIEEEEINVDSLYSKTSFYLFIDLESVKVLNKELGHIVGCLFLPQEKFEEVKVEMGLLARLHYIGFSGKQANEKLLQFWQTFGERFECNYAKLLGAQVASFEQMIEVMRSYRNKDNIIVNSMGKMQQCQALKAFIRPNGFTVLEGGMVDRYYQFVYKLVTSQRERSLIMLVIKEGHLHHLISGLREYKNVVIVYNNFKNIIIENQQYHPLRRLEERVEEFKMKVKLLQSNNGGEMVEKENSLSYVVGEGKADFVGKIMADFKNTAKGCTFIRVARRGRKVKVTWNMAEQARIARTICEIKFTSFGALGSFDIISDTLSLRQFKDTFQLIIKNYPQLFEQPKSSKVKYYSYGGSVAATFHILPDETVERD